MKKQFIWVLFILWGAISQFGCGDRGNDLVSKIEVSAQMATKTNSIVSVSALTQFQWDRLFVIPPYTPLEVVDNDVGYQWSKKNGITVNESDENYLLIFMKDAKVTHYLEFPRKIGEFQVTKKQHSFTPENALFSVKLGDDSKTISRYLFIPYEASGQSTKTQ